MKKIGITGNIACGKTVAFKVLKEAGFKVVDCDDIIKDFYNNKLFITETAEKFPQIITDNKIDLKKLSNLIFSDNNFKEKYETYVFPRVEEKITDFLKNNKNEKIVFVIVPLLFEAGFENLFDKIIFISADENIRKERLIARGSMLSEMADKVIQAQTSEDKKIKKSDYIIKNNTTFEEFKYSIKNLIYTLV